MTYVKLDMQVTYWLVHTGLICLGFYFVASELRKIRKKLK